MARVRTAGDRGGRSVNPEVVTPVRTKILVQGLLLVLLSVYCFLVYALVRPLFGTFGFDPMTCFKSMLAVLALGCFVLWLAPITNVATIFHQHVRPSRRFKRGECPGCGYPGVGEQVRGNCPECGVPFREPPEWRMRGGIFLHFVLIFLLAMTLGGAVAETRLVLDEARWSAACSRPGGRQLESRPRVWPSGYALLLNDPEHGPYAEPQAESRRDPEARRQGWWRPEEDSTRTTGG